MVLALAQALIDHHERTLNAAEIDTVISQTLARQAPPRLMAAGHRARCGDHLVNATTGSWMQVARGSP